MRAQLSYMVEVEDEAELTGLRQAGHSSLAEQGTVSASSSAIEDKEFTVIGSIRGKPEESYSEVVRAGSKEEAKGQVLEADETKTVNGVLDGVVEVHGLARNPSK